MTRMPTTTPTTMNTVLSGPSLVATSLELVVELIVVVDTLK